MKVIVLNDHLYADGGADVVALGSAEALARKGLDVTLFVADRLRADDTLQRHASVVCTGQQDLIHDRNLARVAVQALWNAPAARRLDRLLSTCDPRDTVLHLHSWTKSLSSSVLRCAIDRGFSVVCTLHDYFTVCPTGTLFDFKSRAICHREPMSFDCMTTDCDSRNYSHKVFRVARQVVQTRFGGLPSTIRDFIAVSSFSQRLLAPHLPVGARLHHVDNPIEVSREPSVDVASQRSFICVARLFKPKGQALFLEACRLVGVPAICVGDGLEMEDLKRRFPEARFTGSLPRADVVTEMRQARALVMPSLWYETQGLVVAEAAALGVPAIVSDRCAAVDFIEHERNGLWFRYGEVESLARAIKRLAVNDALTSALGAEASRSFWAKPTTLASHADDLVAVYEGMLARAGAGNAPSSLPGPSIERETA